jgi:hypothetical protein
MPRSPAKLAGAAARPRLRALNALVFGAFAAFGFGLVARPALLFFQSLVLLSATLPWDVPFGRIFLLVAVGLAFETLRLGLAVTAGRRLRALARVPLLLLVLAALLVRALAGEPAPPVSPIARLVAALRAAADALDAQYSGKHYHPNPAALDAALSALGPSHFVYRGHEVALHVRLLERDGAQLAPLPGDLPGTLYVALDGEQDRAFITALTLDERGRADILRAPGGKPLLVLARAGTHSAPGRDPLVPEYPGMQSPSARH